MKQKIKAFMNVEGWKQILKNLKIMHIIVILALLFGVTMCISRAYDIKESANVRGTLEPTYVCSYRGSLRVCTKIY